MNDNQSPTFKLLHRAILDRMQVTFTYEGHKREVCPYILGHNKGRERVLAYQFAGASSSGLKPGGDWKCFALAEVRGAAARDGSWHGDAAHQTTQTCVDEVFVDVNTDVPDQPGRRAP